MEYKLKNYMEELVLAKINDNLPYMDVCKCEVCRMDMAAMVLNSLPPKYIVTHKGALYTKASLMEPRFEIDVVTAIANAAKAIKDSPRHGHGQTT